MMDEAFESLCDSGWDNYTEGNDTFSLLAAEARHAREAEKTLKILASDGYDEGRLDGFGSALSELTTLRAERDALLERVRQLEGAIRDHSQCVTVCKHCGEETPNFDDDVCLALHPETRDEPGEGKP